MNIFFKGLKTHKAIKKREEYVLGVKLIQLNILSNLF